MKNELYVTLTLAPLMTLLCFARIVENSWPIFRHQTTYFRSY